MGESPAKRTKYNINDRMQKLKEKLNNRTVSELQTMLEINQQKKSGRKDELIDRCCDGILYGAIPKCPKCPLHGRGNRSYLKYNMNNGYYTCSGAYDKIKKKRLQCDFYSNNIKRKPW